MTLIALAVVLLLAAVAVAPKRPSQQQPQQPTQLFAQPAVVQQPTGPPAAVRESADYPIQELVSVSLREQQIGEEAAAVASEYRRRVNEAWLADIRAQAAKMLGSPEVKT